MAVTDHRFNGSTITFGGVAVAPLTEFRLSNQPATIRNTGSTDTHHSYSIGRTNETVTVGFLGSRAPDAGVTADVAATFAHSQGTYSYTPAVITSVNVSGRVDGEIRSNLTFRPAATTATEISGASRADVRFNGSKVVFDGTTYSAGPASLISCNYSASCAEVDDSGAGDAGVIVSPGIADRTLSIEITGGTTKVVGTTGATAVTWADTGTLGTFASAIITGIEPGGSVDDRVTTTITFREYV